MSRSGVNLSKLLDSINFCPNSVLEDIGQILCWNCRVGPWNLDWVRSWELSYKYALVENIFVEGLVVRGCKAGGRRLLGQGGGLYARLRLFRRFALKRLTERRFRSILIRGLGLAYLLQGIRRSLCSRHACFYKTLTRTFDKGVRGVWAWGGGDWDVFVILKR